MNAYVLLGIIAFWLASLGGTWFKAVQVTEDHEKAVYAESLDGAISAHNERAEKDKREAVQEAARAAAARTRATLIRSQTNEAIRRAPLPAVCDWNAESYGLLVSAIQDANSGDPATPSGVSGSMRGTDHTREQR